MDMHKIITAATKSGWLSYENNIPVGLLAEFLMHYSQNESAKEDPEAWREECRKKQAEGVEFKVFYEGIDVWIAQSNLKFTGKKEHYREVQEDPTDIWNRNLASAKPLDTNFNHSLTIPHIESRILWLQQREAGTNEVWQYGNYATNSWYDVINGAEPQWVPEYQYRVKPKTVKYYFALCICKPRMTAFAITDFTAEEIQRRAKNGGFTIIGNIEEREIEIE